MDLIKHSTVSVRKYGERGFDITIPPAWVEEAGLKAGDKIDLYIEADTRALVVKPATNGEAAEEDKDA